MAKIIGYGPNVYFYETENVCFDHARFKDQSMNNSNKYCTLGLLFVLRSNEFLNYNTRSKF